MQPESYRQFTASLKASLENDPQVLGLVALGSMADQGHAPDRWSDHDFFVIVDPGQQERLRSDLSWLPNSDAIAFSFRETEHGLKVVYQNGHLLEFAIFSSEELSLAKINQYRVLLDRADIVQRLVELRHSTEVWASAEAPSDEYLWGQFLTNLLVGVGRYRRGEQLSGHQFVKSFALRNLLILVERQIAPEQSVLDNLDPFRRFELAYPECGKALACILNEEVPETALGLLAFSQQLHSSVSGQGIAAIRAAIKTD